MFDAQTSGGLLIALSPDRTEEFFNLFTATGMAGVVGEVTEDNPGKILIKP